MRPKFLLPLLLAPMAMGGMPAPAAAQQAGSVYLEIFGGASQPSSSDLGFGDVSDDTGFDTGFAGGGAIGYDYAGSPWRAEIEFTYRSANGDSVGGDFASTTLALNGYYDFAEMRPGLRPYVGAGLGTITEIDYDVEGGVFPGEYNDRGGALVQAMVGARYDFSPSVMLTGELRYFDAGSRTLSRDGGGSLDVDYSGAELAVGLAYRF